MVSNIQNPLNLFLKDLFLIWNADRFFVSLIISLHNELYSKQLFIKNYYDEIPVNNPGIADFRNCSLL